MTSILAAAAFFLALWAWLRTLRLGRSVSEAERSIRRAEAQVEEAEAHLARLRALLVRLAEGEPIDRSMIEEGRLYTEVDAPAVARALAEEEEDAVLLDVRTHEEWRSGHAPGALHVPLDELPDRVRELPRNRRLYVVCAAGVRSAAACEWLTSAGFRDVVNVAGGMSAWTGPVVRDDGGAGGQRSA